MIQGPERAPEAALEHKRMYLKKLELIGFKSFADKTEFTFPRSVTAVVGPNGCGKSNLVDAFKWIFGEQSAKGLRGEEMKDVIFNGTQTRKPTGFAEVTVVFDNSDQALNIEYAEVGITRRLYRSGESEYLINKQKCRLRDIKELFLDTGLGSSSYSMLEQGKIDVLLQASTQDRRIVFEEAAGISRYRVKKAETLRALLRTTENLSRLGDILDEVEKRMHRLRVQAGKARRYRECTDRLRALRVRAAREDFEALAAERTVTSALRFAVTLRIGRQEDLLNRLRAGLEEQRSVRSRGQAALARFQEELAGTRGQRERTEERIRQDRRRLEELEEERQRKEAERAQEGEARERLGRETAGMRDEAAHLEEELAARRAALEGKMAEQEAARGEAAALARELEARREAVVAVLTERSRVGNRLVQLQSELKSLGGRRERTSNALEAARREAGGIEARLRELEVEQAACLEERRGLEARLRTLEEAAAERRGEASAHEEQLDVLRAGLQDRRSRLEVLRSFEESREGLGGGVQAALAAGASCPGGGEVRGLVADFLRVEARYARAVEAALGEEAQALVVETQEGGLSLLGWAGQEGKGGLGVLALDRLGGPVEGEAAYPELLREAGVLGLLRDRVEAAAEFRELADALLAGVIVVEDLQTAVALSRNGLRPYRLVTLAGERVEPWGAMCSSGPPSAGGLIARRSEMGELTAELEGLGASVEEARARREELGRAVEELEAEARQISQAREAVQLKVASAEGLREQLDRGREQALREVRVGESELEEIRALEETLVAERSAVEAEAASLEARRQGEEQALAEREAREVEARHALASLGEVVTDLRVRLAEAEERGEGLRRALAQLEESLGALERRGEALGLQLEELGRRREETVGDLAAAEGSLVGLGEEEAAILARLEEEQGRDRGFAELEEAFAAEYDRVLARAEESRKERDVLNLREQEGKLKRNALVEKIADEYGLDLTASAEAPVEAPAAPAAPAKEGGDGAPGGEEPWDRARAEEEMKALREKLRHLGNVNLEALEELEELEERHRFMTAQRDDLNKAESDLKAIIADINRTSRELFLKTFESVQQHFNDIFRKCFGGGMAELVLEEGADVLEAGIEIVARPPGKKLTSLSLMSGGEKTMTTIALLFAIFQSRPSPFCILDEVDAPLDESNIRRFVLILRDFARSTQFIIITHNKVTMAEADALYGVTMEERGVSRRVAVEFDRYQAGVSLSAAEAKGAADDGGVPENTPEAPAV